MNSVGITDIGKDRKINQDYIFYSDTPIGNLPNLYIVADGMGGHKAGDFASKYAVNAFIHHVEISESNNPISIIQDAICFANKALIEKSNESTAYEGMGTTLVIATILKNTLYVANVGDSRLYVLNEEITQITKDHSLVEQMINIGEIDKDTARLHANRNIITKAMGVDPEIEADYFEVEISKEDIILLCSDGLTNMLEDHLIKDIIHKGKTLQTIAQELIDSANSYGGKDNISVVLVVNNLK